MSSLDLQPAAKRPSTIRRLRAMDALVLRDQQGVGHLLYAGDYHVAEDGDEMVIFERERDGAPCGRIAAQDFWALVATQPLVRLLW